MNLQIFIVCWLYCLVTNAATVKKVSPDEKVSEFWLNEGSSKIQTVLQQTENIAMAKNIILYVGDGMGPPTIAAARAYKNQKMVNDVQPDVGIFFEQFPYTALMKTHSVDDYVADSSSTATAMVSGVKTNSGVTGVSPEVIYNNCTSHNSKYDLENIATMLHRKGKSIGIVTTTRITHATPSVMYAHSASRDWESNVPNGCQKKDIAYQLIDKSEMFNVILGGGLNNFIPENEGGLRKDYVNLIRKWNDKMKNFRSKFVNNQTELRQVDLINTDYLFGLFSRSHLEFDAFRTDQPSLETMTETAIKILSKNKNGFLLMVEGGRIDHAHHKNKAYLAILETLALEKAVERGFMLTNTKDTLISVTGDHSHVFTLGSYVKRENDITQKNLALSNTERDGKGHTSLLYSNGPGYRNPRLDITEQLSILPDFEYNSGVPLPDETHGGEDIAVYSHGPWSHLFKGVHHQSYIGHVMMYATCVGPYRERAHCSSIHWYHVPMLTISAITISLIGIMDI